MLLVLLMVLLLSFLTVGRGLVRSAQKAWLFSYVERHQEELRAYAEDVYGNWEPSGREAVRYQNRWLVSWDQHSGLVKFQVTYCGFGSESTERSFCYAPDGEVVFEGIKSSPTEESGRYFYGEGDNWVFCQPIVEHWFWVEQHW